MQTPISIEACTSHTPPPDPSEFRDAVAFVPPPDRVRSRTLVRSNQRLRRGMKLVRLRPEPVVAGRRVVPSGTEIPLVTQVREGRRAAPSPSGDFRDVLANLRTMVEDFHQTFFL